MTDQKNDEKKTAEQTHAAKMLEVAGWALFFIWIGISFLAKFHIGVGLVGIALITLGGQIARKFYGLKLEGFWVIVGLLFLLGGIWELFTPKIPLVPILLIVAGAVLLGSILLGKHKEKEKK
jgi:hypothetical protein